MGKEKPSEPHKIERTGNNTFNVHHTDGSVFECNVQDSKQLDKLGSKIKGQGTKIGVFSGVGTGPRKPLICDGCKQQVHKLTSKGEGKWLCPHCQ